MAGNTNAPRPEDLHEVYADVAVLVRLPDGRLIAQWGRGTVGLQARRDKPFDPLDHAVLFEPPIEHITRVEWADGYRLRYGAPAWDEAAPLVGPHQIDEPSD